ncbi:MAG TPA: metallophosphoesterase [Kofleriaceae bacterium]|nr:metallophosphoesterase [Kofleriaceae bacterium]
MSVSWIYADEDASIARELVRLASVLERQGLLGNHTMGSELVEPLFVRQHAIGAGIAMFMVSPAALASPSWLSRLHQALDERGVRTVLVIIRPVDMMQLPERARSAIVLPKDGTPIATRRDRDDALLEVIQALQELAASKPKSATMPNAARRGRTENVLSINEIFRLNGPPTVTFVEPPQFRELQLELGTMGTGLIVEGPSKTGKSTAIHKAMDALGIAPGDQLWWAGQSPPPLDELQRTLDELRRSEHRRWLVIDDFHYLEDRRYLQALAFTMKALADQSRSSAKVTLIGINPLGASLVQTMPDLAGRFRIMRIDRERDWERSSLITELIVLGEQAANIRFRRRDEFVLTAGGSFFIAQLLCNRAAVQARVYETQQDTVEIERGPADVINSIRDELAARYRSPMLHFAAFDAQPPPRGAGLSLLWLLARSPDGFVSLKDARLRFPGLGAVFDWFLQSNLSRCFDEYPDLRGLLYFNRATGTLTMEDPQLAFYLRALDWTEFAEASGHGHVTFHPADGPLWPITGHANVVLGGSSAQSVLGGSSMQSTARVEQPVRRLLHLSDLHFATTDQSIIAYSQLAADLRQQGVDQLDALVVSGDLVNRATAAEYAAADLFLEQLKSGFGLKAHAIVIVPGNHDVSWSHGDSAYQLVRRAQYRGTLVPGTYVEHGPEIVEVRDDEAYHQRFAPFAELYEKVKGEPYPLAYEDQATITQLPEAGLCILGLNSAWEIDRQFPDRASLHAGALARALTRLPTPAPAELRIAVFHHPVHSSEDARLRDAGFLQQLAVAGFRLILHGHVHRADSSLYRYDRTAGGRQLDIITAGTFGAPVREWVPGYPLEYNLLLIDPDEIVVETRCRREVNGAWEPDARWLQGPSKDPLPRYTLSR